LYSYSIDPADLDVILRAAADAACKALAALDPDMDGDTDVPGADAEFTDGDVGGVPVGTLTGAYPPGESAPSESADENGDTTDPAPDPAVGETTERTVSAMPESTPAAETTAATFTQADLEAAASAAAAKAIADH
jgi:hypothetical protein